RRMRTCRSTKTWSSACSKVGNKRRSFPELSPSHSREPYGTAGVESFSPVNVLAVRYRMPRTLGDDQPSHVFLAGKHRDEPKPVFGQGRERRSSHISKGSGATNASG